ncbi:MAG TPA: hypothetical protein VEK15_00305 [Vicinamibacteria bacterium]|nr:hypothetical protein [Vicinamibacteria bacterium]
MKPVRLPIPPEPDLFFYELARGLRDPPLRRQDAPLLDDDLFRRRSPSGQCCCSLAVVAFGL